MPYVQIKNLEIFYEKMGTGENVIFLHSGYSRGILAFASQMLDFQKQYTSVLQFRKFTFPILGEKGI